MNIIDILILAFLAIGAAFGLYRGFFKELVGTIGLLIAAIVANIGSPYAKLWLAEWIHDPLFLAVVVWAAIFIVMMLIMSGIATLLDKLFATLNMGWLNRMAGGLFGVIKYTMVAALLLTLYELAAAYFEFLRCDAIKYSEIIPILHKILDVVMPWFTHNILHPALAMFKG